MKVYLVDATYELFRAYFGAPKKNGLSGREVGACAGILRSLAYLLREENVTHIACAFDHVIESFRNDLFPGYKTSDGVPEELLAQFELAEDVSRALGIATWPMVEFEADDAIATAAARFDSDPRVSQVIIASPDKDLAQCVRGSRVVVWDRRRRIVLGEEGVRAKFGVSPPSIPDYLALVGDSADGLPGLFGWGKKSAAEVLARYARIEDIPVNASHWQPKPRRAYDLAAELRKERENALLYRHLATLRLDVPLDAGLDDLAWRGCDSAALESLCRELGEEETLSRLTDTGGSRWRSPEPLASPERTRPGEPPPPEAP